MTVKRGKRKSKKTKLGQEVIKSLKQAVNGEVTETEVEILCTFQLIRRNRTLILQIVEETEKDSDEV